MIKQEEGPINVRKERSTRQVWVFRDIPQEGRRTIKVNRVGRKQSWGSRGCQGRKGGERAGKTPHNSILQQSKGKPLFIACGAEKINHCG